MYNIYIYNYGSIVQDHGGKNFKDASGSMIMMPRSRFYAATYACILG